LQSHKISYNKYYTIKFSGYYLSIGDNMTVIYIPYSRNQTENTYYLVKDYLASVMIFINKYEETIESHNYDPWGNLRNPIDFTFNDINTGFIVNRGFTGHEYLPEFGLINMNFAIKRGQWENIIFSLPSGSKISEANGRMYDPVISRMLSPDNFVQDPTNFDNYNRYSYCLNNPLKYTDPSGELAFIPILAGIAYGAIIGSATSVAIYTTTTLISGQSWSWNSFGQAAAFGAVGGALGGGFGALGAQIGTFGQSLGYNLLANVASNSATTLAFGGDITAGGLVGMVAGGFIGAGIGNFNGVQGGAFKNIVAELGFGISKGAITGAFGGAFGAAADGRDMWKGFTQGAKYGAISGGTLAGLNILAMRPTYVPDREYGDFGNSSPVYRKGTFIFPKSTGITIGRNLVTRFLGEKDYDVYLTAHETGHYYQQSKMGFANFYGRIAREYLGGNFISGYDTPGFLDFGANIYSLDKIGYFRSDKYGAYINNSNFNFYYAGASRSIY